MSTDSLQWKEWNTQGFIPGPDETAEAFAARIAFCQQLQSYLNQQVSELPFKTDGQDSLLFLQEVFPLTQELYGIAPKWVPIFFSNYQLTPWHAGCAWIFQLNEQTPTAAFLQLRSQFRTSSRYLSLYKRQELIAHELAHVGRMLYQEPQFEEFFAYQSSSSWRRWLGPIVQSSKESLLFILLLGLVVIANFAFLPLQLNTTTWWIGWSMTLLPVMLCGLALIRLIRRHRALQACQRKLEKLYSDPEIARHLLYRLRDEEIQHFAHLSPAAIRDFMEHAQRDNFRWRFLSQLYPPPTIK